MTYLLHLLRVGHGMSLEDAHAELDTSAMAAEAEYDEDPD